MCYAGTRGGVSKNEEDDMTHESYSGGYLAPEHFSSPTPETRLVFNAAIKQLQETYIDQAAFVRHDSLSGLAGDLDNHYIDMFCGIEEWHRPTEGRVDSTANLSITIATSVGPPAHSDSPNFVDEVLNMQPPKYRQFSHGEIDGDMTDAEYATAVAHLSETIPPDEWSWIKNACRLASTEYDADFLPFAVTDLLDTATSESRVCSSKQYMLDSLFFTNGAHFRVSWLKANSAYIERLGDYDTTRRITITMPTDQGYIQYIYHAFADDTERMLVVANDEATRAKLESQGFAAVGPSDGMGWAAITAEQRDMGIQAPNDTLMRQFSALIRDALESGAMPA